MTAVHPIARRLLGHWALSDLRAAADHYASGHPWLAAGRAVSAAGALEDAGRGRLAAMVRSHLRDCPQCDGDGKVYECTGGSGTCARLVRCPSDACHQGLVFVRGES